MFFQIVLYILVVNISSSSGRRGHVVQVVTPSLKIESASGFGSRMVGYTSVDACPTRVDKSKTVQDHNFPQSNLLQPLVLLLAGRITLVRKILL